MMDICRAVAFCASVNRRYFSFHSVNARQPQQPQASDLLAVAFMFLRGNRQPA
jgi:hypothetical protein